MLKTACWKYNTKYNMNEQHKTTEDIDKVLTQKKALLAQKEAELGLLKNKKMEDRKVKIENLSNEYKKLEEMYKKICAEIEKIDNEESKEQNKDGANLSTEQMNQMSEDVESTLRSLGSKNVNTSTELTKNSNNKKTEEIILHPSKSKIDDLNNRRFSEIAEIMGDPNITADKREKLIKAVNESYDFLELNYKYGKL